MPPNISIVLVAASKAKSSLWRIGGLVAGCCWVQVTPSQVQVALSAVLTPAA
jgi:hypothetical protein